MHAVTWEDCAGTVTQTQMPHSADDKPDFETLKNLQRKDGTSFSVIDELGREYNRVATQLLDDKTGSIMENIREDATKGSEIKKEMFERWLGNTGKKPVTWRTLITLLESNVIRLGTLASDIRNALE